MRHFQHKGALQSLRDLDRAIYGSIICNPSHGLTVEQFNDELLAKQMIPLMVKAFIITRAERGATLYQEQHKQLSAVTFTDEVNVPPVSTLGSGDIFGIAFLYFYLKKKNYPEAAERAQKTASHSTKFQLTEKHRELKAMRELL